MPIMVNVGNSYKEVTAILDKNGNAIDTVYAQNGSPVYFAWNPMTLTGVPPLQFKANGTPLTAWSIYGNGQQTGTPTPDAPIMPEFVGVRTGNLFPLDINKLHVGRIENDGTIDYKIGTITVGTDSVTYQSTEAWRGFYTDYIAVSGNEKLTISPIAITISMSCNCYDTADNFLGKASAVSTATYRVFTLAEGTAKVRMNITSSDMQYTISKPMLNTGSTALPYEPFGWAEKITCAGQTVPVYLGQTQTVRRVKKLVLTGTEDWNVLGTGAAARFYISASDAIGSSPLICSHFTKGTQTTSGNCEITALKNLVFNNSGTAAVTADWKDYLASEYAAGHPVTVWYVLAEPTTGIVNEPLAKIGDYADELHSTDAGVTIPTIKGQNTLTVEGDLPPSTVSITGLIRPVQT